MHGGLCPSIDLCPPAALPLTEWCRLGGDEVMAQCEVVISGGSRGVSLGVPQGTSYSAAITRSTNKTTSYYYLLIRCAGAAVLL